MQSVCVRIMEEGADYVFGYGSIINNLSRKSTLQCVSDSSTVADNTDHTVFATLSAKFGYRRCWCYRSSTGFTALGLKYYGAEHEDNRCGQNGIGGVLFLVPSAAALSAFDIREAGYRRISVPYEYFNIADSSDVLTTSSAKLAISAGRIWTYIPEENRTADPDENFPLLQTYIDTCIRGCLEWGGTSSVSEFLITTFGWNEFYLNDAPMSRRPWLHRPQYSVIDKCLEDFDYHVKFAERKHPEEFSSQHLTSLRGIIFNLLFIFLLMISNLHIPNHP